MNNLKSFTSLPAITQWRAMHSPDDVAFIFLIGGEDKEIKLTYKELDERATQIAFHLQMQNMQGERVLLFYPQGLEFICAFLGCLYAGAIAVPAYPPKKSRTWDRITSIQHDAGAKAILTSVSVFEKMPKNFLEAFGDLSWLLTDNLPHASSQRLDLGLLKKDSIAFLQYTSGSTNAPKGVMVTHENILSNSEIIRIAHKFHPESVSVSWLPCFHDMGLIGGVIQPLYVGCLGIILPPDAFIEKPIRWLQVISKYKGTNSGAPNFAYDLCCKKVSSEQVLQLDLSSWRVAYNGAEPIAAATLTEFYEHFKSAGFKFKGFYPNYGLAESTLFVSGGLVQDNPVMLQLSTQGVENNIIVPASNDKDSKTYVGCGHSWMDTDIIIVNPETTHVCNTTEIGEIWIRGKSVAHGYWRQEEETAFVFRAFTADQQGPYLRTGDLGFIQNNELFVTGRIKDLIIIRGLNYYPQDIEETVWRSHPAMRFHAGAAFSITVGSEEKLIVVNEIERRFMGAVNQDEIVSSIKSEIYAQHGIQLHALILLKIGEIPKTSSGKIQRRKM